MVVVRKTSTKKPAVKKFVAKKPTIKKFVAKKPVVKKTPVKKVVEKIIAKKPVVKKRISKQMNEFDRKYRSLNRIIQKPLQELTLETKKVGDMNNKLEYLDILDNILMDMKSFGALMKANGDTEKIII